MWSGSFLFSKTNGKSATTATTRPISSPFGVPTAIQANAHRTSGGVVPPILLEENRVPKFYKDCLVQCGATSSSQLPNTGLVYNLMVTSQLPKDDLSDIWLMVNRTIPGQLTRPEFFSCLALIALAQKGENISALCNVTTLPIPHLQTFTEGGMGKASSSKQNSTLKHVIETADLTMRTKSSSVQSSKKEIQDNIVDFGGGKKNAAKNSFIPTNLMSNTQTKKNTNEGNNDLMDLIGDLYSNSGNVDTMKSSVTEAKRASISYELLNLDLSLSANTPPDSKLTPRDDDPYAVLREGPPEDEYLSTWQPIIIDGVKILQEAIKLLEQSPTSTEEISHTEAGIKFIQSLHAIADVINRVALSLFQFRPSEKTLMTNAKDALLSWKDLTKKAYIFQALEDKNAEAGSGTTLPKEELYCGVCIQPIANTDNDFLQFGGIHYHSGCANFWANQINVGLPRLEKF